MSVEGLGSMDCSDEDFAAALSACEIWVRVPDEATRQAIMLEGALSAARQHDQGMGRMLQRNIPR
eukprot:3350008-Karenia_brevis.AAC.1